MTPRNAILHCLAVAMLVGPLGCAANRPPANAAIVFVNVNVLPMDGERVLARQTVVVENGVITQMRPGRDVSIPAGARTIDGTGKYLMPGLVDVHVHLASNPENELRALLKLCVANGVTTVLNLRGTPQILERRSAVAAGRILSPRI